jgi:hypothetical protein
MHKVLHSICGVPGSASGAVRCRRVRRHATLRRNLIPSVQRVDVEGGTGRCFIKPIHSSTRPVVSSLTLSVHPK